MQIGREGVALEDMDLSQSDREGHRDSRRYIFPFDLMPIFLLTVHAGPDDFVRFFIYGYSTPSNIAIQWIKRTLLAFLFVLFLPLTLTDGLILVLKKESMRRIRLRYTILPDGLGVELIVGERPWRFLHKASPRVPWSLVCPYSFDNFIGFRGDRTGRFVVPSGCFETFEQRQLFESFAGGAPSP